jgi:hypothetical protein
MSSGLSSPGFAEGFVNGFGMVDQALQRRRANEIENKKIEQDQANNLATLDFRNKELGLQGEKNSADAAYNTSHLALTKANNEASQLYNTNKLQADKEQNIAQNRLTSQSNNIQLAQANKQAAQADRIFKNAQDRLAIEQDKARREKLQIDKSDAMPVIQSMLATDPTTGQTSVSLSHDPKMARKQIEAWSTVTGLDGKSMIENSAAFSGHVANIKSALSDPTHWDQNKTSVLGALNATMRKDIEAGKIGQKYDGMDQQYKGGIIENIEISDVMPNSDGTALVAGVKTTYKMPNGQLKWTDAPMTDKRMANANLDPNVRNIPLDAVVGKIDAMDQFASYINSDPTSLRLLQTQIAHAYPKEKGEDAYTSETITDSNGNQVAIPFNKKEGTYGTPSDQQQVTSGQAQWKSTIKPVAQQQQPQGNSQTVNNIINSDQQSGLQGQSNRESVKNNELEKQYRGSYRPFNDILDNPDLTAQAKLSAIRRIENSHNK